MSRDRASDILNWLLVPVRLGLPQPLVARLPILRTTRQERVGRVLALYEGDALDVGCGTNELIRSYRERGGHGTGVDVHPWPGVDLVVADSGALPWPDASFDRISFVASLNHIPTRSESLREAHRLLKADGHLIVTNLTPGISRFWHLIAWWDRDQHERGMKAGEIWGFRDSDLRRILADAGFQFISRRSFMWGLNHTYVFAADRDATPGLGTSPAGR
jgi:ubiquinone/menaquinone biosynthesis C-methylase UbiE